jgi:hypothetical protein
MPDARVVILSYQFDPLQSSLVMNVAPILCSESGQ